jgi:uncharacterized membrane protein YfcA
MIFTAILSVIYVFIYGLTSPLRLAPDVSLPSIVTNTIGTASSYISALDRFLPITELVFILTAIFIIYESGYFAYKLVNWVIRKIPTIS